MPVRVRVKLPDGNCDERVLNRKQVQQQDTLVEVIEHQGGIYQVIISNFNTEETARMFNTRFPDFTGVNGLILDLRSNNGGSGDVAFAILARLLYSQTLTSASLIRVYIPPVRMWGGDQCWLNLQAEQIEPAKDKGRYDGPVAVLTGPLTASAAEDLLVAFKQAKRGPIVGQPTCGSTGQPVIRSLPGGGLVRICSKRDTFADGTDFVGRGVGPDIKVSPTMGGLRAGRDEVLEEAISIIRG